MTQLYKWMLPDLRTSYQNVRWPVTVGDWTPAEKPVLCRSGWHCVEERHVLNHLPGTVGATLWVVKTRGVIVHGDDKFAATSMRLVREIGTTTDRNLRLFACDVAEDVLPIFWKVSPNDTRPADAIATARRYALGEATESERAAAGAAAGDASEGVAGAAAGAAAWAAAGAAAEAAAGDAAWAAAGAAEAAAGDAAWAAAGERYSNWLVVRLESGK
jgi:hypothetical protein